MFLRVVFLPPGNSASSPCAKCWRLWPSALAVDLVGACAASPAYALSPANSVRYASPADDIAGCSLPLWPNPVRRVVHYETFSATAANRYSPAPTRIYHTRRHGGNVRNPTMAARFQLL